MAYPKEMAGLGGVKSISSPGHSAATRTELVDTLQTYFSLDARDKEILLRTPNISLRASDLMLMANRRSTFKNVDGTMSSFLRDLPGKNRSKHPVVTDPYMTNQNGELISRFGPIGVEWLHTIADIWRKKRWPLKAKEIGGKVFEVPDTEAMLAMDAAKLNDILANRSDYNLICETVADADSLARFSVQRYVRPFWYVRSYNATSKPMLNDHKKVLAIMTGALTKFASKANATYAGVITKQIGASADPFGTNTGWPIFLADYKGKDAKYLAEAIAGVLNDKNCTTGKLSEATIESVDSYSARFRDAASAVTGLTADLPLYTVQPSRRFKPNTKMVPDFEDKINGLLTGFSRGIPDQRLVYMFSYLHNLVSAHPAAVVRAWKKIIPGLTHDDEGKQLYSSLLQSKYLCLLENDAGGFDANISNHHVRDLGIAIGQAMKGLYKPELIARLIADIVSAPLVLPTPFSSATEPSGNVMIGDRGLESGSKWTGEIGSFMTKWMNCVAYLRLGWMTERDITDHMLGKQLPHGRLQLISGDDNTHIIHDAKEIAELSQALKQVYSEFGVKADLEFSDRFLMRHVRGMLDTPVPGRIFQQRASNEKVPPDQFTASMGWLSSCEHFGGITFTAAVQARMRTGRSGDKAEWKHKAYMKVQGKFLSRLLGLNDTSLVKLPYLDGIKRGLADASTTVVIDAEMKSCANAMTKLQMGAINGEDITSLTAYIATLMKDVHSPSVKHTLDMLLATNKAAAKIYADLGRKGSDFQQHMLTIIGLI